MMKSPFHAHRRFWKETPWLSCAQRRWFCFLSACLAIYISYAAYFSHSDAFRSTWHTLVALLWFVVFSLCAYALMLFVCKKTDAVVFKRRENATFSWRFLLISALISLVILGVTFAACYPGGISYDVSNQWRQVQSGEFNNWHPLFHTLMIWLATRITTSYPFVVLLQLLVFTAAMSYLSITLRRGGVPSWLVLGVQTLVVLSAPVRNTLMYVGKDSAMTIGALLLTVQAVQMLYTRGEWLKKPLNAVAFGLALAFTTLVRHNAMLFTLPLLCSVLLCYHHLWKRAALSAGVLAVCMALVQGPLFGALDVVYPSNLVDESVGIPMTILGNAKQKNPDALDQQTQDFLATLATDEEWKSVYQLDNYNSIKFTYDRELISKMPIDQLLGMTVNTVSKDPRLAFEAFNAVTDLVWGLDGREEGYETVRNSGDIETYGKGSTPLFSSLSVPLLALMEAPMDMLALRYVFLNIGVQLLMLLLVALWMLYRRGVRALTLAFPALIYNLGTMLLLCGNDARFFQFFMAICLPSILALLFAPSQKEN